MTFLIYWEEKGNVLSKIISLCYVFFNLGSAPQIDRSAETNIKVAEGRYAVLRCIATGSPKPSIHYEKDGVTVSKIR